MIQRQLRQLVQDSEAKLLDDKLPCSSVWSIGIRSRDFAESGRDNDEIWTTGFPKKDARFSKLENIPDLLSDEKDGKIMENIDFSYFSNRASFMGNPVW